LSGGQAQGWSPECFVGVQGIGSCVKQWQARLLQPLGQLHSEHRIRQPTRPEVWQQNHSPEVEQPGGHPPAWAHVLHV